MAEETSFPSSRFHDERGRRFDQHQIEPHTWKDEKHTITILGENLIINQSDAVQTKIHQFLHELGITRQQHDENNRPFHGFS